MFVVCSQSDCQSVETNDKQIKSGANSFSIFFCFSESAWLIFKCVVSFFLLICSLPRRKPALLLHWCIIYFNFTAVFLPFLRYPFFATEASKAHQLLPAAAAENVLAVTLGVWLPPPLSMLHWLSIWIFFLCFESCVFWVHRIGRIGSSRLISFEE